jgi:hypothetical protein
MFKKIALCAMLVLILAPASVMAAGQGQAPGIGNEAGSSLNVQHRMAGDTLVQEKFQNGLEAGSNGDVRMLQTRSCDQTCEQDQFMVRNMTRDQLRPGPDAVQQQDGSAESLQNRFGLIQGNGHNILSGFADQLGVRLRNAGGIFRTLLP